MQEKKIHNLQILAQPWYPTNNRYQRRGEEDGREKRNKLNPC